MTQKFFFDKIGNGSDGEHFQIGLTRKTMLSRVELNGMFHLDATYQIVKYNYPLIILGVTDITRKFHPICYMFTSHEQERDYDHFFESLLHECKFFDFKFEPSLRAQGVVSVIKRKINIFRVKKFYLW